MSADVDVHPLDALEQALQAERRALLEHDVDALLQAAYAKLAALRDAERVAGPEDHARIQALQALNQANAVLLARRRREIAWTLRYLGRSEATGTYDMSGFTRSTYAGSRLLGCG
ncbi:flagellar protein FlgN [Thermomonas alba]|uniref:flagellar protein FlgN n=1 Tax=Thermomonas alba TaxID=2888525 RepID=UPI001F03FA9A|nr:flagellar protein FlgN [Thermomonas alba]